MACHHAPLRAALFLCVLIAATGIVNANDTTYQTCRAAIGNNGMQFTQQWQQGLAVHDPQLAQQFAGTYQASYPYENVIQEQLITFYANGNVEFKTRNCNPNYPTIPCYEDYGVGRYAIFSAGNGWTGLFKNLSSTAFTNACLLDYVQIDAAGMTGQNGVRFQRVR